jgi:hypothetical protein
MKSKAREKGDLALRENSGRWRLSNFGLREPFWASFAMPFQPVAKGKDKPICLCGREGQLAILSIHIPAVRQKPFLLALQYNHIAVIHQVRRPVLVPSRSELHMRNYNQIQILSK